MNKLTILLAASLSGIAVSGHAAQEKTLAQVNKLMSQTQGRLHNVQVLLATYGPEHADQKSTDTSGLADVEERLRIALAGLAEIDKAMLSSLPTRFDNLPRLAQPGWKFAVRHKPFSMVPLKGIDVHCQDGKAVIYKEQGSDSYHVCLDRPLRNRNRFVLRFSLTVRGGAGTPVPYFGLRDTNGREAVFVLFSSAPNPEEIHEIKVSQSGDTYYVIYNNRIQRRIKSRYELKQLESPLYLFFHMNDRSEVVIHDVFTDASPPKPKPPAPEPDDGQNLFQPYCPSSINLSSPSTAFFWLASVHLR